MSVLFQDVYYVHKNKIPTQIHIELSLHLNCKYLGVDNVYFVHYDLSLPRK